MQNHSYLPQQAAPWGSCRRCQHPGITAVSGERRRFDRQGTLLQVSGGRKWRQVLIYSGSAPFSAASVACSPLLLDAWLCGKGPRPSHVSQPGCGKEPSLQGCFADLPAPSGSCSAADQSVGQVISPELAPHGPLTEMVWFSEQEPLGGHPQEASVFTGGSWSCVTCYTCYLL